jgi:predicted nucleic acid-binding protein
VDALILVDSSGWIEYLAERPRADAFAPDVEVREAQIVASIQLYEVYKVVRRHLSEERAVAAMHRAEVVALDDSLTIEAADLSLAHGLAMADALVHATALRRRATHSLGRCLLDNVADVARYERAQSWLDGRRFCALPRSPLREPARRARGGLRGAADPRLRRSHEWLRDSSGPEAG